MTDPRIRELIDEYNTSYKIKYKVSPIITGKTAKLAQNLWKWADMNKIAPERIYAALWVYFSQDADWHNGHPFEIFYTKINTFLLPVKKKDDGKAKAEKLAEKTNIENQARTVVLPSTDNQLLENIRKVYSKDELGCEAWLKKNDMLIKILTPDPTLKSYQMFLRECEIARRYFGEQLIEKCSKPLPTKSLKDEIKKAKEIEINS